MTSLYLQFENLIEKFFISQNFVVRRPDKDGPRYDFLISSPSNASAVVEVKLYKSLEVGIGILTNAARQVESYRRIVRANKAILIVSCRVDKLARAELKIIPNLVIYDFDDLATALSYQSELASDFARIMNEALAYRIDQDAQNIREGDTKTIIQQLADNSPPTASDVEAAKKGESLCEELKAIPAGRATFSDFENKCRECLEYAFSDDLYDWNDQVKTHSGIYRFDLIAKIKSKSDFWLSLIRDFRSRYVVFEFKNYKDKITQGEILSTEKYLFPLAMRGTGIIVSRLGAEDNAHIVARGALRESGKVILILSIEDMCEMVDLKDEGKDPSDVLSRIMDDMLIRLER